MTGLKQQSCSKLEIMKMSEISLFQISQPSVKSGALSAHVLEQRGSWNQTGKLKPENMPNPQTFKNVVS